MELDTARKQPILELRIHGVSNTPPEGMLDLETAEVERADGDRLGSFWTPCPEAEAIGRAAAPGTLRHIPPGVRREAYSWGAMARIAGIPGGKILGTATRVAARLVWAVLAPLGLANVAYWARPIRDPRKPHTAIPDPTAAASRIFALLLTLLFVASTATAAIDTLGTKCMRPPAGGNGDVVEVCASVPEQLYWLARWDYGPRIGLLSAVPVLLVLVLVLVAQSARVRFDGRISTARCGAISNLEASESGPLLRRAGFWIQKDGGADLLLVHLGAAVALVALLMSWTADPSQGQRVVAIMAAAVILIAVVMSTLRTDDSGVEIRAAVRDAQRGDAPDHARRRRRPRSVFAAGLAVLGIGLWVAAWFIVAGRTLTGAQYVGIEAAPSVFGTALAAIATSALVWRYDHWAARVWWAVPVVATGAVCAVVFGAPDRWAMTLVVVTLAVLTVPAAAAFVACCRNLRPAEGWDGAGPGVFLLASAAGAAVISALVVLGVQWWLRGSTARQLAMDPGDPGLTVPVLRSVEETETVPVPPAYTELGVTVVAILFFFVVTAAFVIGPALFDWTRRKCRWVPIAQRSIGDQYGPTGWAFQEIIAGEIDPDTGSARKPDKHQPVDSDLPVAVRRVQRARRLAALTHRAELAVGGLAIACWAALLGAIAVRAPEQPAAAGLWLLPDWTLEFTVPMLGAVAVGIVGGALAGGAGNVARPFGILWDLMCFLPRSAHPFGPPSYAERAVPELRARVDGWLTGADLPANDELARARRRTVARNRRVVLSAHSLGAVIAVAVLMIRNGNPIDDSDAKQPGRVGLLTYGVQLRPYFARFFPELLGPQVLGVPACGRPAWRGDPWKYEQPQPPAAPTRQGKEPDTTAEQPTAEVGPRLKRLIRRRTPSQTTLAPTALRQTLRETPWGTSKLPAWVNLWRRTDFLGFPAVHYHWSPVDRGAEEVDRGSYLFTVADHSAYTRSLAYQRGFQEVVDRLDDRDWLSSFPALCETSAWWRRFDADQDDIPLAEAQAWRPTGVGV